MANPMPQSLKRGSSFANEEAAPASKRPFLTRTPRPVTGLTWAGGDERHRHPLRAHPERPERITEILKHLRAAGIANRCTHVKWPGWDAPDDEVHDSERADASGALSVPHLAAALAEVR